MRSEGIVLVSILLASACYSYQPAGNADVVAPANGSRVQVRLTQQGSIALSRQIGSEAVMLDGDIVAASPDSLRIAVRSVEDARRVATEWKGEQVAIPRDAIASVGERKLSVGATALLGGLAAGTVIAASELFSGAGASTVPVNRPPGGQQ
jgi:hypothetical protein